MTSPEAAAEPAADTSASFESSAPSSTERAGGPAVGPPRTEQSREDTDVGWGDYAGRDDDRLYRDRPPHWRDY
jgi:hypothetical protein